MLFPSLSFCWLIILSKGAGQAYVYMETSFTSVFGSCGFSLQISFPSLFKRSLHLNFIVALAILIYLPTSVTVL